MDEGAHLGGEQRLRVRAVGLAVLLERAGDVLGIGCREGQQWKMHSTLPGGTEADYRQASSSEINAIAAEMMADAPVDAETERQLLESGWK